MAGERRTKTEFPVLPPDLQVTFYYRLGAIRERYLQNALRAAVSEIELSRLDDELSRLVSANALRKVASFGIRGEVFFPTPLLLKSAPFLLGYYRLLYGLSQKEFYNKGPFGRFKRLEENAEVTPATEPLIEPLCRSMIQTGTRLVESLDELSVQIVHELQLLTVGPQFRGSENTRIGEESIRSVYELIAAIVSRAIQEQTHRTILIENAAGRPVLMEFAADPDVHVTEKSGTSLRSVLSIEVKGGGDASNVHNRLGEAEKSHLKAKKLGCTELWTILRVSVDDDVAQRGSPTTTRFFNLERILNKRTLDYRDFRDSLCLRLGIRMETPR